MTQQIAVVNLDAPTNLPAHLQGFSSPTGQNLVVGGATYNRIGLKGNRFRLIVKGVEEAIVQDHFLDVIIVGASPGVSRMYYEGIYDGETKTPPTCYSADGVVPNADVHNKQSTKCQTCPQNQIGSKVDNSGRKFRACGFFKRLAVVLPSDLNTVYRLEAKGMSIFGEGKPQQNMFSLAEYGKKLQTRGLDPSWLVTRLTFDTDESVPKLLLTPIGYISQEQAPLIADLVNGQEVADILEITAQTVDISGEVTPPDDTGTAVPPPQTAQAAPQAPAVQTAPPVAPPPPVAQPAPPQPAPVAPAQPQVVMAPAPNIVRAPNVQRAAPAAAAPNVARPTPPRTAPAVATVVPAQQPAPPQVAAAHAPVNPAADDADLAALINSLGD